jgi:hypothetical protein
VFKSRRIRHVEQVEHMGKMLHKKLNLENFKGRDNLEDESVYG